MQEESIALDHTHFNSGCRLLWQIRRWRALRLLVLWRPSTVPRCRRIRPSWLPQRPPTLTSRKMYEGEGGEERGGGGGMEGRRGGGRGKGGEGGGRGEEEVEGRRERGKNEGRGEREMKEGGERRRR